MFSASYNLFNGEEHFLSSLRTHRSEIDYINVVVQYRSNYDEEATEALYDAVRVAQSDGLVDEVIEYQPDVSISPYYNELAKRNIGLEHSRSRGAKYFLTLDADEYYHAEALREAKKVILAKGVVCSGAHTFLHIKRPIYRSRLPDSTCVCFWTRIDQASKIVFNDYFPILVDGTRRLHGDRSFYMFGPEDLAMMHMNLVRRDGLASKLRNTASAHMVEFIETVRRVYDEWEFGDVLAFPNKPPMEIVQVPDYFSIDHVFARDPEVR